jgi:hypothetical protein
MGWSGVGTTRGYGPKETKGKGRVFQFLRHRDETKWFFIF